MNTKIRILLVDDEPGVRSVLHKILTGAGYDVVEASDGKEVLGLLKIFPIDLVILDIIMPEMDGIETIIQLRRKDPSIRILALSGGSRINGRSYLGIASKLGAHKTMAKPFEPAELLKTLEETLAMSASTVRSAGKLFQYCAV